MTSTAAAQTALERWQNVLEHGSARDLRSAGAELAERLRETLEPTPESEYVGDADDGREGCPDCGQDTLVEEEHEDGAETVCSNVHCGWRP